MTNAHIIKTDPAYGAVNGYPEVLGDPVGLIAAIVRDSPRLDGAACVGRDPELWFADPRNPIERAKAVQICGGCPVRDECGDRATETGQRHGIWGGVDRTTPVRQRASETHCKVGHPWTKESTYWNQRPGKRPYRVCRICSKERLSDIAGRREPVGQLTRAGLSAEQIAVALRMSSRHVVRLRAAA